MLEAPPSQHFALINKFLLKFGQWREGGTAFYNLILSIRMGRCFLFFPFKVDHNQMI